MKNVLLVCGSGASSGFIAANVRKVVKKSGDEISFKARSDSELEDYMEDIDLLLIGPHLSYMLDDVKEMAKPYGVIVDIIPQKIYGSLDGEGLLKFTKEHFE